jgi:hypothetical protein
MILVISCVISSAVDLAGLFLGDGRRCRRYGFFFYIFRADPGRIYGHWHRLSWLEDVLVLAQLDLDDVEAV